MTETPDHADIGTALLDELRSLRDAVERGIVSAKAAAADVARVEAKSDRRARRFSILWSVLALVLAAFITISTVGYVVNERHRNDDEARRSCFQDWANRTANRSQTLAQASDARIRALNLVLTIRAKTVNSEQLQAAIADAAAAGAGYERVSRDNPPIPPSTLACAD